MTTLTAFEASLGTTSIFGVSRFATAEAVPTSVELCIVIIAVVGEMFSTPADAAYSGLV